MSEQHDVAQYEALSALSEDDLLFQLGDRIEPGEFGAGRASRGQLIKRAQQLIGEEMPLLAQRICSDPRIVGFRSGKTNDQYQLFVAICDIVGSLHGGLPVATLAMLLVRMGLNTLCGEVPKSSP